ncbi:acyl carrier protein [Catellatospora tritici]|uniref:acyl carrier protein n=1 Tax=Catellatospora tritici TaxID=2851566 RepID=UPI001C2DED73|nr:acyl carrier protein [Catellatospora tritici]MBV1849548.1 acyl carrier protein [Catellatospora tritici]
MMEEVLAWILEKNPDLPEPPTEDEDLIGGRLIDSLAFLEFIYLLEQLTGSPISLQEVTVEDFRTLARIEKRFFGAAAEPQRSASA